MMHVGWLSESVLLRTFAAYATAWFLRSSAVTGADSLEWRLDAVVIRPEV